MAEIKTILEKEHNRKDISACRLIHLYQEGNFLRAYEVSAWLFRRFINDKYKISNRKYKGMKETVALLGFPPASLEKLLAQPQCNGLANCHPDGDELRTDISIPRELIPDDYEADLFMQDYAAWKRRLAVDEPIINKKTGTPATNPGGPSRGDLLQRILAFPLERKTLIESYEFLSSIRQEIANNL